jgi:hypothetical protein
VSPTKNYLARCLPHATLVLEPLPVLHLITRLEADGCAASGLPRAVTAHARARLRVVTQAVWTGFGRGSCPRRTASGPESAQHCSSIFTFKFLYLFQEILLNFQNSYTFVGKSKKYKINFYRILKSKSVQ